MKIVNQIILFIQCVALFTSCNGASQSAEGSLDFNNNEMHMSNSNIQERQTYNNSIGMEFIRVPKGTFFMGSEKDDPEAYDIEKPRHEVTISEDFYLGKYEVTQQEWENVMGSNPYDTERNNGYGGYLNENFISPENPVTVSWKDAQEFIQKLNKLEGHDRYKLPTEAEWEYAARAGSATAYSFGDDKNYLDNYAWHSEQFGSGHHHQVGQKLPNPWGLFDMHGNVWEWVADYYSREYYSNSPSDQPLGPESGSDRVVRGGSWHITSTSWRSAFRKGYKEDYRGISIGFRLAMEAE